jgi:hypothetical protein
VFIGGTYLRISKVFFSLTKSPCHPYIFLNLQIGARRLLGDEQSHILVSPLDWRILEAIVNEVGQILAEPFVAGILVGNVVPDLVGQSEML